MLWNFMLPCAPFETVESPPMNRREMLKTVGLGAALPVLPQQRQHHQEPARAAKPPAALKFFSAEQNEFVTQLAELIIPQTETPGARAAEVNLYVDKVLAASEESERKSFLAGLEWLDSRAHELHGAPFLKLAEAQQVAILKPLATRKNDRPEDQPGMRFFERLKALTITGYYTSELGYLAELGYTTGFTGEFPGCTHAEGSHK